MSIIEKALDKLGDEAAPRPRRPLTPRPEDRTPPPGAYALPGEVDDDDGPPVTRFAPEAPSEVEPSPLAASAREGPAATARPSNGAAVATPVTEDRPARRTHKVASLKYDALSLAGFITPDEPRSSIAEQYRIIKRPLLLQATPGGPHAVPRGNLILVTSSVPGEGKTFVSINLAMSIAMELDRTVLLVDADVDKQDAAKLLGADPREGLTDYLRDPSIDLADLLVRTNLEKLTLLPSGERAGNVTELFSSEEMARFSKELADRYPDRVIIFDSPPLLATTGASVLAHHVGQIVMVVEAVRTSQGAVREALRHLEHVHNPHIGLVLNKSREGFGMREGYGYGYYAGYGQ